MGVGFELWELKGRTPNFELQEFGVRPFNSHNSTKNFFYALQNLFLYWLIFSVNGGREFSQQIPLLARQFGWDHDINRNKEVAAGRTTAFGNTPSFDAER
jgi:hypothetical protein